jgi:tryptophan synthase alpha chain
VTARYATLFARAREDGRVVVVPFAMLGFPDGERSLAGCESLIAAGADALELGIPFSDAVADGPVIQAASQAALASGTTPRGALALVTELRRRHPTLPIGLLTYANLLEAAGIEAFYAACAAAGADSLLVADVPALEFEPYAAAARAAGIAPVMIVPPNAPEATVRAVARLGRGYTYLSGRAGVTGTHAAMQAPTAKRIAELAAPGA